MGFLRALTTGGRALLGGVVLICVGIVATLITGKPLIKFALIGLVMAVVGVGFMLSGRR